MAKMKGLKWLFGIIITLLILLALIDQVTTRVFSFDLLLWLAFGNATIMKVYAWIVGIIGGLGILSLVVSFLSKATKSLR